MNKLVNFIIIICGVFWSNIIQMLNGNKFLLDSFKLTSKTVEIENPFYGSLSYAMLVVSFIAAYLLYKLFKKAIDAFDIPQTSVDKITLKYNLQTYGLIFSVSLIWFQILLPHSTSMFGLVSGILMTIFLTYNLILIVTSQRSAYDDYQNQLTYLQHFERFNEKYTELKELYTEYKKLTSEDEQPNGGIIERQTFLNKVINFTSDMSAVNGFHYQDSNEYPDNVNEIHIYKDFWEKYNYLVNKFGVFLSGIRNDFSPDFQIIYMLKILRKLNDTPKFYIDEILTKTEYKTDVNKACFKEQRYIKTPIEKVEILSSYYYSIIMSLTVMLNSVNTGVCELEKDFVTGKTDYENYMDRFLVLNKLDNFTKAIGSLYSI